MRNARLAVAVFAVLVLSSTAHAVTYIVPPDREMIQLSDEIVVATGVTSHVERTPKGGIITRYTLRIEEVLKGERVAGDHLVLTERGGVIGDQVQFIPGTPSYEAGERYLVFTETNNNAEPTTFSMGLGQFRFTSQQGRRLALRGEVEGFNHNLDNHVEKARDAEGFLAYIRGILAHDIDPEPRYFVPNVRAQFETHGVTDWPISTEATRGSYQLWDSGNQRPFRWSTPATSFVKSGTPVGPNGNQSVTLSFSQWNGAGAGINYSDGGQDNSADGGLQDADGKDAILFDDPNGEVSSGVAGIGGITQGGSPYTLDSESFWNMFEVDVVMNNGSFAQNCYDTVMVHEIGHTLGFRHSNQPRSPGDPTTTNAIMNSSVMCGWNGILKQWDIDAANTVYGSGPICVPPSISLQPAPKTITPPATSTTLSVTASGTAPLSYQWYVGNTGDTSQPIGTNSNQITVSPTSTTNFWVRVSGSCAPVANSNTVTVTVVQCQPPTITSQSGNRTITEGDTAQLSVSATGTSLSYQWYIGNPGTTTQPVGGGTNSQLTVSPDNTTTYWVRVSGACEPADDSEAIVVTVQPCPEVLVGTPTVTTSGSNAILNVEASSTASGALTYAWFRGNTPGSGGTQVGTTKSVTVGITPEVVNYWVRVRNSCDNIAVSELVAVAACSLPSITTQPSDQIIQTGLNATLSLVLAESSADATVTWYRGVAPDKSNQVGTGTSVNVGPLTATTLYWASVGNSCGEVFSRTLVVTVNQDPICVAPSIITNPISQQIPANTSATLNVILSGTAPFVFQWYEGAKSDTSKPIEGATLPALVTPKILGPRSFWVRVTNACGTIDTEAALITVPPGRRRAVSHP